MARIIFIHGLCCSGSDWASQAEQFAREVDVVAPDLPGHGAAAVEGEPSIESMAEFINRVRQDAPASQTVFAGHSLGCRVALEAARRMPDGVSGLVLLEGGQRATGDAEAAVREYRSRATADNIATLLADFRDMFSAATPPGFQAMALDRIHRMDPAYIEDLVANLTRWDASEAVPALEAVRAPVLVMQSTVRDPGQARRAIRADETPSWLRLVGETVPREVETVRLTGLSHFPQIDAPEQVTAAMAAFLQRIGCLAGE